LISSVLKNKQNCAGLHFFNPVQKMPLVEIVRSKDSSDECVGKLLSLVYKIQKYPIIVDDVPGFLVNRILFPYINNAALLYMHGVDIATIDSALFELGFPMGPLRLLDEIGHDVASHVGEILEDGYGQRMKVVPLSKILVESGRIGKKTGRGLYCTKMGKKKLIQSLNFPLNLNSN
jgi:3-hydroxyacyl-CoA dehydrogenase / enoyl-CoA hydratase / 3-hydroxybutyryl-CoA epimerase